MKTILYQPLFINPQAYFVFPQLYHIEKGDSYIEPANITGQLIINNLSEGLTLTPTVNVIQDSNQVDFSLFKGKHIRISQYTNIGAVVLGEWYIPGTPEPEQPDWFKESIVAWYSPYCKQKLTNYDVIESYAVDFTTFTNASPEVELSNNKFSITGDGVWCGINYTNMQVSSYPAYKVTVKGLTGRIIYYYRKANGLEYNFYIVEDGIYDIPISYKEGTSGIGMGYNCTSTTKCTISQLPTSVLRDYSGNNYHAHLYGFKGKLNSGVGVYKIDFSKSQNDNAFDNFERFNNKFIAKGNYNGNWNTFGEYDINGIVKNKVTIKITGLNNVKDKLALEYGYFTTDSKYIKTITFIDKDGVYTYDLNDIVIPEGSNIAHTIYNRMYFGESIINDINLIVEEIPDYPNQLCYDGKSYAVAYGLPILTDYTVVADRTWFKDKIKSWSYFIDKSKAFVFERTSNGNNFSAESFAAETSIKLEETNVSYQTKTSYNGNVINYHSDQYDNDDRLVIGSTKDDLGNQCFIGCHGDILIFNRSLTEYEISWVKNNMMCSKPQETDKDAILMLNIL